MLKIAVCGKEKEFLCGWIPINVAPNARRKSRSRLFVNSQAQGMACNTGARIVSFLLNLPRSEMMDTRYALAAMSVNVFMSFTASRPLKRSKKDMLVHAKSAMHSRGDNIHHKHENVLNVERSSLLISFIKMSAWGRSLLSAK